MRFFVFILFLYGASTAWSDPTMHVITNHEELKAKDFKVDGIQIQEDKVEAKSQIISRDMREQFILKADLQKQTATWDEFDKDILMLRTEHLTAVELFKHYQNLPSGQLQKLKTLILKYRKDASNK